MYKMIFSFLAGVWVARTQAKEQIEALQKRVAELEAIVAVTTKAERNTQQ